jgi:hypothetical protein
LPRPSAPDVALRGEFAAAQPCPRAQIWPTRGHDLPLIHPQACLALPEWGLAAVISRTRQPAPGMGMEGDDPASAAGAAKQT